MDRFSFVREPRVRMLSLFLLNLNSHKVVFIHIPKTGGTSIRTNYQVGKGIQFTMPDEWKGLPSFAFTRDPFDRAVSCWRDFRFRRRMTKLDFEPFLRAYSSSPSKHYDTLCSDPKTIYHHMAPITHPVHGLSSAKFVGTYANLQTDFDKFCTSCSIDTIKLPLLRASSGPIVERSSRVTDIVCDIYKDDYYMLEAA